jgi:hypothetical protein
MDQVTKEEEFETTFNYLSVDKLIFSPIVKHVKNGRLPKFVLKGDGFQLLQNITLPIEYEEFRPSIQLLRMIKEVYGKKAKEMTKAYATFTFPPILRSEKESNVKENEVEDLRAHRNSTRPHDIVHNDYTIGFQSFLKETEPDKLRQFLAVSHKEYPNSKDLHKLVSSARRIVVIQFWGSAQPRGTVIEHHPLAICAPRSVMNTRHIIPAPLPEYGGVDIGANFSIYLANAEYAESHGKHQWYISHPCSALAN